MRLHRAPSASPPARSVRRSPKYPVMLPPVRCAVFRSARVAIISSNRALARAGVSVQGERIVEHPGELFALAVDGVGRERADRVRRHTLTGSRR